VLSAAEAQYRAQRRLVLQTLAVARSSWARVSFDALDASWPAPRRRIMLAIVAAQRDAVAAASGYTAAALAEQGLRLAQDYRPNPAQLVGVAADGRPLDTLLDQAVIHTKAAIADGAPRTTALAEGRSFVQIAAVQQVRDAARVAVGLEVHSRPRSGYIRMLQPPSCSRCVVLAGKFYRTNDGFDRHPDCDCIHVPTAEDAAGDLTTNPDAYFQSLSPEEQDRVFTKAGARAIRDGADISQVVNARRGANGLSSAGGRLTNAEQKVLRGGRDRGQLATQRLFGRDLYTTTEGTTRAGIAGRALAGRGGYVGQEAETVTRLTRNGPEDRVVTRQRARAPRLMPESIYEVAETREEAIRLLRRNGFIF
jgi:hypothetical protein